LIEVHAKALESLTLLQSGWVEHVEEDAATVDELSHFKEKHQGFASFCHEHHESADGTLLIAQVEEASSGIESATQNFEQFHAANEERNKVFAGFRADSTVENADAFKSELIQHLSQSIVVKENRHRYQKEQFNRMLVASQIYPLCNRTASMENFCRKYSQLIEELIDQSHNYKCPKIQANYDDFNDQTIRPLNSTIFFYFFSGSGFRRNFARWMLASARYPNEKVKTAYMRFFS